MKPEEIITGTRWEILKALSKKKMISSELARHTKTTLPNISQNIRLLEAYGYVTKTKQKTKSKPSDLYELKKEFAQVTICGFGSAEKTFFNPDIIQTGILNSLFLKNDQKWIIQLLFNKKFLELCKSIAYIESNDKEIHLLIVSEKIDEFRKEFSHIKLELDKEKRKIACWSHTKEEAINGLNNKEKYFLDLFKKPFVIIDPDNILSQIRGEGGI